tara:strand:+ start:180 stop:458 length:279 start_codon:yes stop_codon:yes gene_type:complete
MLVKIKLVVLLIVPLVLLILPADFFDNGQSLCLSQLLLEKECPGCGLTRGLQHLGHFDFQTAWEFNKLSFVIFPVATYYWAREIISTYKKIK